MHGFIFQLQDVGDHLRGSNAIVQQSQYFVQNQEIAFLCGDYLTRKIKSIQDITFFLILLLFVQLIIAAFQSFKPEYLDIKLVQLFQKVKLLTLAALQELNDDDTLTLFGSAQTLANRHRSLPLAGSTVNFC